MGILRAGAARQVVAALADGQLLLYRENGKQLLLYRETGEQLLLYRKDGHQLLPYRENGNQLDIVPTFCAA